MFNVFWVLLHDHADRVLITGGGRSPAGQSEVEDLILVCLA